MSKQDRQGARTPADLERRYQFGRTFAEVSGIASDAKKTATEAKQAAVNLDKSLNQDGIFKRLTNNGKAQGIFRDNDGNIYFNAEYIVGKIMETMQVFAEDDDGNFIDIKDGRIYAGNNSEPHFMLGPTSEPGIYKLYLDNITQDGDMVSGSMMWNHISLGVKNNGDTPFEVTASSGGGSVRSSVLLRLPAEEDNYDEHEKELYVYWKSNGDGSYSLVGYENELDS